jgi:hypothetical protein
MVEYLINDQKEQLLKFGYVEIYCSEDEIVMTNEDILLHFNKNERWKLAFPQGWVRNPHLRIYDMLTGCLIDEVDISRYVYAGKVSSNYFDDNIFHELVKDNFCHSKRRSNTIKSNRLVYFYNNKTSYIEKLKTPRNKYFLEVYKYKHFTESTYNLGPGKDNKFEQVNSTLFVVKLFTEFIKDDYIKALLPDDLIEKQSVYSYSSTCDPDTERLTFEANLTKELIMKYDYCKHVKYLEESN